MTEICNLIRGGSEAGLTEHLKHIFHNARREKIPTRVLNMMLIQLLAEVYRIILTVTDSEKELAAEKHALLQQVSFPGSLNEAEDRFTEFCLSAQELVANQKKKSGTILCEKAVQMIEQEYKNPNISLNYVSSRINVSPNYLTAILKKNTGKSFIDLLTGRRMEAARTLLLTTSMKIREISEECGYNDQHYFSYCFKKNTGTSPGSLRQKGQAGNKEREIHEE